MIREDWVEARLEEVCSIFDNIRKPVNTAERNKRIMGKKKSDLYPYYGATGLTGYIDDYLFDEELVLVGEDAAPFFDYTKNVAYMIKGKTWVNNHAHVLKSHFNNKYLCFYLNQFNYEGYVSGTTRLKLNQASLKKIPVPLAPLPEQRSIVAKIEELFSELDSGIASLKKAKDQLEVYRQAVLKAAFEGKLTREWRKENQYTEKYVEEIRHKIYEFNSNKEGQDIPRRLPTISFEKLPSSPFGWEWIEAHKVCQSVRDGTHDTPRYVKEGIPLITSKNLKKGNIDFENINYISLTDHKEISNRSKVEKNDILFGMIGTIGNPVIVKENNLFSIKNVGLFKKNEDLINPRYLYHYLSSWFVEKIMLDQELIRGTTQKFVALGGLRMLPIPLPSLKEQEEIIKEIESRLSVCENIEATIEEALEKAEALGQSILKKAFEGKLLSNEELEACRRESDWEPAEDLLKRIKEDKKGAKSNG